MNGRNRDPVQRLIKRYGSSLKFRTVQKAKSRIQPCVVEVLIDDRVIGRGTNALEKMAKKAAAREALLLPVPNGSKWEKEHLKSFREHYGHKHPELDAGHLKEALLVDMFRDRWAPPRPAWLIDLFIGDQNSDRTGVDLVAITDRGRVPIQIKSSLEGAKTHASESTIPVFIYSTNAMPFEAYEAFLHWLTRVYKRRHP